MKQIILIISVCFSSLLYSCTDDNLADTPTKESSEGKRSITFAISAGDENNLNVTTKAKGTVITDDYAVKFYLFEKNAANTYELIKTEGVTQPLYTIEDLKIEGSYKYAFIATSVANKSALNAMDFSSVNWGGDTGTDVPIPSQDASVSNKSVLENCFISFFDDRVKSIPTFGTGTEDFSAASPETIAINRDLDIFGCGSYIAPGMTFNTPINAIMERQFGIVEFVFQDAQIGDELTCSFSSEYYRLYLSQFILNKTVSTEIISDNLGKIPDNVFLDAGLDNYTEGDYYSASAVYKTFYGMLPIFTRTQKLGSGENSIQVYMPYTTAEAVGNNVDEKYKANYIRTNLSDINGTPITGQKGSITLKVKRGGVDLKTYTTDISFPIYRNGKTIFRTVGDDFLQVNFGPANESSGDGIQIDGDGWHGEN